MRIDVAKALARGRRQVAGGLGEHRVGGGEQLARFVMERLGDPLRLPLQAVVQTPKHRFGLRLIRADAHGRDEATDGTGLKRERLGGGSRVAARAGSVGRLRRTSSLTGFYLVVFGTCWCSAA